MWLLLATSTTEIAPVVDREPLAVWQLALVTLAFVAGFVAVVIATRRTRPPESDRRRKPPHPRDSSWWNP